MNEFRRLINRKVVIGFIALLIINVSLYVYQQTKGAGIKELRFETMRGSGVLITMAIMILRLR